MRARGISVSLGADGAACNNRLDMFDEMRLAATLQAVRHAPGALTARDALWMATREGARALGLEDEIGSIEPGKRADLILVDRDRRAPGAGSPTRGPRWSTPPAGTDVRMTMVDGEILVDDFALSTARRRSPGAKPRRGSCAEAGIDARPGTPSRGPELSLEPQSGEPRSRRLPQPASTLYNDLAVAPTSANSL